VSERSRVPVLDGWRAISILLVLASHLLPIGPSSLQLNLLAAAAGMAVFFSLSGFLIVTFLYQGMPVWEFLKKRLARILPLAWVAMIVLVLWQGATEQQIGRNFLFVSNIPPADLLQHGEHLWSLCVEMQFYLIAALLAIIGGRRAMWAVPFICVAITSLRVLDTQFISIVTWHRADEILAGGTLALLYLHNRHSWLRHYPLWLAVFVFLLCSHPSSGFMQYLRPYAAAAMVGSSLVYVPDLASRALESAPMAYVAKISYALYVIHGILVGTWLGTGETMEKYLKRPLLIAATFALAHLSTRYLETPILRMVRSKR
jgi:peptidoglycan/LPS O-acetylase OafA/YrhL